jgi:hypothetical protein
MPPFNFWSEMAETNFNVLSPIQVFGVFAQNLPEAIFSE